MIRPPPSTTRAPTISTNTSHPDHKNSNPQSNTNKIQLSIDSNMANVTSSSSAAVMVDGLEADSVLSRSEFLTREEVLKRRSRRVKQLAKIYRDQYWALMEELKLKYREYYWQYGKSPFQEDEDRENNKNCTQGTAENGNNSNNNEYAVNQCGVHGCKAKAMALTKFCHMHILSDAKQKLYKACNYTIKRNMHICMGIDFVMYPGDSLGMRISFYVQEHDDKVLYLLCVKFFPGSPTVISGSLAFYLLHNNFSSPTGPILCGKPILRSTIPSLCAPHFQKAEKHVARALKKAGLNATSTSKLSPKFHLIVAEYVHQIQAKRRAAQKATIENFESKEDNSLKVV
ncbi:unnamed protein product [Ilex paraguariensis]|uniref:KAT8 regulatory NSL complex subunit 2 n=1 Tax=Ilex paraguariensis TaxID=185542 RepID=A0ABC8U5D4_9AQUA